MFDDTLNKKILEIISKKKIPGEGQKAIANKFSDNDAPITHDNESSQRVTIVKLF